MVVFLLFFSQTWELFFLYVDAVYLSSQLDLIQEFCKFADTIHTADTCTNPQSPVEIFIRQLRETVFNENVSCDDRRNFFIKTCTQNTDLFFFSMHELQEEAKENIKKQII